MNKSEKRPLLTVITAVFNGDKNLENTIKSIISQTYDKIEYIIIDGGSTDRSVDIIKKYADQIDYWISERDNGISDAFNKGVKLAKGDYINFQGDGDGFASKDAVERLLKGVSRDEHVFISARIQRLDINGNIISKTSHVKKFNKKSLLFRMSLPHQGLLTHKSYFQKYGLFDHNLKFCMDYDHLLRSYKEFRRHTLKISSLQIGEQMVSVTENILKYLMSIIA